MSSTHDIAVVGAYGTAGEALLELMAERAFPVGQLFALGVGTAVGRRVQWANHNLSVSDVEGFDFSRARLVLFVGSGAVCERYADVASAAGAIVIDCTATLSRRQGVPSVVPEVNATEIEDWAAARQLSQPSAAAIHLALVLAPIERAVGLARVQVATYHAVSADGEQAAGQLADQTVRLLNGRAIEADEAGAKQIAFNVLPQVGVFDEQGHSDIERDLVEQTRRMLAKPELAISVTAARVPVFFGHSQALHIETRERISAEAVRELLGTAAGVEVVDRPADNDYATAVTDAAAQDAVFVSRIRADLSLAHGINIWVVADDVRKGGVLNGLQIAERLLADYL